MASSWKLEISATTQCFRESPPTTSERAVPILPATTASLPARSIINPIRVVVVLFPLVPVTAMKGASVARKASSTSLQIRTPWDRAFWRRGRSESTPGLTTIRSACRKVSGRCCPSSTFTPLLLRSSRSAWIFSAG